MELIPSPLTHCNSSSTATKKDAAPTTAAQHQARARKKTGGSEGL